MSKDAVCLVIDVGTTMAEGCESLSQTRLDLALNAASMLIQQKIMDDRKTDQISIILFGCDGKTLHGEQNGFFNSVPIILESETDNEMNDADGDGFKGIKVVQRFASASVSMVKYLKDSVVEGTDPYPDYFEALIVACDAMIKHTRGKKYSRKIILFTDASAPISTEGLSDIKEELLNYETTLQVIGFPHKYTEGENLAQVTVARSALKRMAEESGGLVYSIDDAFSILSLFRAKATRINTTFRGNLEFGNCLNVPVHLYSRTSERKLPSAKKASGLAIKNPNRQQAAAATFEVNSSVTHVSMDESASEISKDHLQKLYRYGRSLIPLDRIAEEAIEIDHFKSIKIIGFVPADSVAREFSMGHVCAMVPDPSNNEASFALSALIQGMYQKDYVAIGRYVRAANANPKLVALSPHIKETFECIYMSILPFSEDVRRFAFSAIKSRQLDDNKIEALDSFIDDMDLMGAFRDSEGNQLEAFKPKQTFNVAYQRVFNAISARAMDESCSLEPLDERLVQHISPMPEVYENASSSRATLKSLYALERNLSESSEPVKNIFTVADPKQSIPNDATKDNDENDEKSSSMRTIVELSSLDPVGDFKKILSRRDAHATTDAIDQMSKRIVKLVEDSFGDKFYEKSMLCLGTLRDCCVKEKLPDSFNSLIRQVKDTFKGSKRRDDFWQLVRSQKMTLINETECPISKISALESTNFLTEDEDDIGNQGGIAVDAQVDDELLDMLD